MFVKDSMTTNPITINSSTPILEAINILKKHKIRQLPVVDNNKLVGLVSRYDLMTVSPSPASTLSVYEINYLLSKMVVKDCMNRKPITVEPGLSVEEAALVMRDNKLDSLLVMENNQLIGIITESDIFDQLIQIFGFRRPGCRIVVEADDKVGLLADIVDEVRGLGINLIGVALNDKADQRIQIMLRVSVTDSSELVGRIKAKGITIIDVR
ncbi:MAG: CBS domain-containing protein [Peptococcaceae bacterium]|nr:CBS domain-containing protein [Peptococcaceae bacterium]